MKLPPCLWRGCRLNIFNRVPRLDLEGGEKNKAVCNGKARKGWKEFERGCV